MVMARVPERWVITQDRAATKLVADALRGPRLF